MPCSIAIVNDIWIPPCGALLLLLLVYPLWSWRRLEAALRYLNEEYIRLSAVAPFTSPADNAATVQRSGRMSDFLERRIEAMRLATRRLSDLHQFVSDNLSSMPDANLVIDDNGILMLHNRKAHDMRAPQSSILALLELQRNDLQALQQDELFGRIEKSVRSTRQPGAGLGLAFVGTVMHQHGGTVALVNAGTPGACFLLCLPAADTAAPDEDYSSLSSR